MMGSWLVTRKGALCTRMINTGRSMVHSRNNKRNTRYCVEKQQSKRRRIRFKENIALNLKIREPISGQTRQVDVNSQFRAMR